MRDEVLQLVLHSQLNPILTSLGKVVSNEQFLIFLCGMLELDRTSKDHAACRECRSSLFACSLDFSWNFNNGTIQRETCLPIFIFRLHTFQLQALSAFSVPPQRNSTYPSSHAATELPAHRTEPLLYCQPRVKPPRITTVSLVLWFGWLFFFKLHFIGSSLCLYPDRCPCFLADVIFFCSKTY